MIELHLYRIEVATSEFIRIDTITTYQNLQWYSKLNGIGSCRFNMSLWDEKATTANLRRWRTNVAVVENDTILFFGPISKLNVSYNDVGGKWQVECLSYFAHLQSRFVDTLTQETTIDAGAIAWNLINTVESRTNGELMIDEGDIEATKDRDRTYEVGGNIAEKIFNLTNVLDGFDFNLRYNYDADKKLDNIFFDVYANRGSVRNDLPTLIVGQNVENFQATTQDDIINTVTAFGAGTGDARISSSDSNATSQVDYTRRESILTFQDVSIASTLDQKVVEELRNIVERYHINVQLLPDTVPTFGSYILGDSLLYDLKAVDNTGYEAVNFKGQAQVIEIAVNLDQEGVKHITPKLEVAI